MLKARGACARAAVPYGRSCFVADGGEVVVALQTRGGKRQRR